MATQDLLTVFVALTALTVLIQAGIVVGLYLVSTKLNKQADRVMETTRNLLGPMQRLVENLQAVSARIAEFGGSMRGKQRQMDLTFEKAQTSWHDRLLRWRQRHTA